MVVMWRRTVPMTTLCGDSCLRPAQSGNIMANMYVGSMWEGIDGVEQLMLVKQCERNMAGAEKWRKSGKEPQKAVRLCVVVVIFSPSTELQSSVLSRQPQESTYTILVKGNATGAPRH